MTAGQERDELARLRDNLAGYRAAYTAQKALVERIEMEYAADYELLEDTRSVMQGAEQELRQKLCDFFYLTSDKKPVEGLSIKEVKNVVYDKEKALDWVLERLIRTIVGLHVLGQSRDEIVVALKNDALFLALDEAAIKKSAESFGPGAPFKIEKVAQATIATDLSKYL